MVNGRHSVVLPVYPRVAITTPVGMMIVNGACLTLVSTVTVRVGGVR